MKLSEKGLKKFERHEQIKKLGYVSLIDEIEFEPGDFKGIVCLTVEEAKLIQTLAKMPLIIWDTKTQKAMTQLQKRIDQAEGKL